MLTNTAYKRDNPALVSLTTTGIATPTTSEEEEEEAKNNHNNPKIVTKLQSITIQFQSELNTHSLNLDPFSDDDDNQHMNNKTCIHTKEESKNQRLINPIPSHSATNIPLMTATTNITTTTKPNDTKLFDHNNLLSLDKISELPKSKDYPCHVFFVVHGIGAKQQVLTKNLNKIRQTIEMIRKKKKDYFQCPIHIKMIDWKSSLCPNVKNLIERVTLQTNKKQRNIVNQVPTDLLFYLNQEHSKTIVNEVIKQANHTYHKLKEKYPNLKASFIGHSLGSVILYDLLTKNLKTAESAQPNSNINHTLECYKIQKPSTTTTTSSSNKVSDHNMMFNFPIENIFFIGSPLSMFLSLNKTNLILLDEAKICKGFYNIFHPNDLLAYRLEPLIHNYIETPPYEIPYIKNDGLKKHKEKTTEKGKISFYSGNSENIPQDGNVVLVKQFKRYDYALQEGYFENIIESLGIFGGHWVYWDSQDLFYFILKKIHSCLF